jgi:hypothetical protein
MQLLKKRPNNYPLLIMFLNNKTYKKVLWKRSQRHRDAWERKFNILIRNVLNKQFKDLSHRIDTTNYSDTDLPSKVMSRETIEKMMINLYTSVGLAFAKEQFQSLKSESQSMITKDGEPVDKWVAYMRNYATIKAGKRITSIAESGRDQAVKIIKGKLDQSVVEGWGADETARAIRKGLIEEGQVINQWRALRIARTEIMTASNQGTMEGARSLDLPLEKYWISTFDSRTRDTHANMEDQNPKDMDEDFQVGDYMMDAPGATEGGPEEVINCRCTIAHEVKQI